MPGDDFFDLIGTAETSGPRGAVASCAPRPPYQGRSREPGPEIVSCWAQSDNAFYGVTRAHDQLPAAVYRCEYSDHLGPILTLQNPKTDDLIRLPESASDEIVEEIRRFRCRRSAFSALGYLHKRGVLLWGPAGSGKTSTIMQLCDLIISEENGVAVYADHPEVTARCLQLLRRIEPDRPLLVIFEDLDALVARFGENEYLALLDGESQVNNVVSVASTNYPERLDRRFVDRPGRFASIRYIGMPGRAARETYILAKCPQLANGNLEAFLAASDGLSIDHLREMIVLTQCDAMPLEEAERRMRAMKQAKPSSERSPDGLVTGFQREEGR